MMSGNREYPFVGRTQELAELAALFDAAALAKPQIAVVHGPEGVGKSSLQLC